MKTTLLNAKEKQFFRDNGYLVKKSFVDLNTVAEIKAKALEHLKKRIKPYELEQEVNYPGSPKTTQEKGGDTIRRLLLAYSRDEIFAKWQTNKKTAKVLKQLFSSKKLYLVQSHHNCIMTKQPQYSSQTNWHKDIRYWHFNNHELINTWLPLGDETTENGCLQVIPATHHWNTKTNQLDNRLFLRQDLKANKKWLEKAINVELQKGDLLFFHAALFHAAGRNQTKSAKNALVSTYHSENNLEISNPYPHLNPVQL